MPIHNYYAADIGQYAGQEVTVRFEFLTDELHPLPPWPGAVQALNHLYFSPIPEPSPAALLIVGGLFMMFCHRRRV